MRRLISNDASRRHISLSLDLKINWNGIQIILYLLRGVQFSKNFTLGGGEHGF